MNKIFTAAFSLSLFFNAQAQLKLGIRVAPQLTWSHTDNKNTTSNGTRVNSNYALVVDYYFSDNYAIGTEFCMQYLGTNLSLNQSKFTGISQGALQYYPSTQDLLYNYKMQYIQVPILLKMRTKEIGYFRYYAEFGAAAGFLVRAKADVSMDKFGSNNVNINNPDDEDKFTIEPTRFQDGVAKVTGSMIIGAGLQYNIFKESYFVVGLRYHNGFTSYTQDSRWKSNLNSVALNIGILF